MSTASKTVARNATNTLGDSADEIVPCGPLQVIVPGEWIDFLTQYNDMFRTDHSGYWMYAAEETAEGWLAFEMFQDKRPTPYAVKRALDALVDKRELPARFFTIDRAFAVKAYLEGVKRWGVEWYHKHNADAADYDIVVQMAALGEVRYG